VSHARSLPVVDHARRRLPLHTASRDIDRAARPRYTVWELTLRCDLACEHCGSRAGDARANELSTDEALDLVRQIAAMGCEEITLIGGEAYLHEGWTTIGRAITDAGMHFTLVSGGFGMNAKRAQQARDAGAGAVSISIDAIGALHDELRGRRGAFEHAIHAIRHLRAAGLPAYANTQITRPALRQIEPLLDRLIEEGIAAWQVSMTVPMGRAADRPDLLLEPYQVLEVMPMLARIHRRFTERGLQFSAGNDIGYFGPYETMFRGHVEGGHHVSCTAGRMTLGIESDGSIKGCPSLPSSAYVGGNVRDHSLEQIWERAEPMRFTRDRTTDELWGHCRDCYYAEECMGGCSWTAHVLFGRRGNNPYCHHRAIELLRRGRRERLRHVARAPGAPFDHGLFELIEEEWPDDERARAEQVLATGEGWITDSRA
jgi:radical SAM protein with 4Fe4S-binding SPASM domain